MSATVTRWPDRTQLYEIMHAPEQFISDASLSGLSVHRRTGRILSWNGQRTIVFRGTAGGRELAVRCPLAADAAAAARYTALRRHLTTVELGSFVDSHWIEQGIQFEPGVWIPMMTMDWVDGSTIEDHVTDLVDDREPERLSALADKWWTCCADLSRSNVAHGDIHAGNVMVRTTNGDDELVLIDYDGVWVPDLDHPSMEIGLPAFQHPQRSADHWGQGMDAFANLVMYLSLRAVAHDPTLWTTHHRNDDTMLFDMEALRDAPDTAVWEDLDATADAQIRHLSKLLLHWRRETPDAFESLEAAASTPTPAPTTAAPPPGKQTWGSPTSPPAGAGSGTPRQTWAPPSTGARAGDSTSATPPPKSRSKAQQQTWPPGGATPPPPGPTVPQSRPPGTSSPDTGPDWEKYTVYLVIAIVVIAVLSKL